MYVWMYLRMCAVYVYTCMYGCMYACTYVGTYVHRCVCTYGSAIHTYIYVHMSVSIVLVDK